MDDVKLDELVEAFKSVNNSVVQLESELLSNNQDASILFNIISTELLRKLFSIESICTNAGSHLSNLY